MGNPTIKAQNVYLYQNLANNSRTLVAMAADGTGSLSLANDVLYYNSAGTPTNLFTPSATASKPYMAYSRDYAFFTDGVSADLQKWNINNQVYNWGIAAPSSIIIVAPDTEGGTLTFGLTAAGNASAGNTIYTGTGGLTAINNGTTVTIFGFSNAQNNGTFIVVSSTGTTLTVNNPSGTAETIAATVSTLNSYYPSTTTNGWAANAHVGSYEGGTDLGYNFGLNNGATNAYVNPGNVFDGNESTYAYATGQHTHQYYGCVWSFSTPGSPPSTALLNILSEVPVTGTDGQVITNRSAGIWYSTDAGNSWNQVYNVATRSKQWDSIALPSGQVLGNVQVMAFTDSHDDMYQKVYEINIQASTPGTGPITLLDGRAYTYIYGNSVTQSYSDIALFSNLSGPIQGGQFALTDIVPSSDPQVDTIIILATADSGDPSTLYEVATLPNTATTFTDTVSEPALLASNIWQETDTYGDDIGVIGNDPPPNGSFPILHQGRIWLAFEQYVYFSKALSEVFTSSGIIAGRYEEAFPPSNNLDISPGSELIHGLQSDGYSLYIGTERHIRRVNGDSPSNFSTPSVIFSETGLLNQDVWQIVFREGTPAGSMWMTPDFRVIYSDFNTYMDVGTPIQDQLNNINQSAAQNCFSNFVSYGPYNLYVMFAPTGSNTTGCDTAFVFDLHTRKWYVWQFADNFLSGVFYFNLEGIPRWMIYSTDGTIRYVDPTLVVDKQSEGDATAVTTTIQTVWMGFTDIALRKVLNNIEVMTSDPNLTVTVEAAQNDADFKNPTVLVSNAPLVADIFGGLKAQLIGYDTLAKFFRVTFKTTSSSVTSTPADRVLSYFSAVLQPINRA
jgi:hypothetical protein